MMEEDMCKKNKDCLETRIVSERGDEKKSALCAMIPLCINPSAFFFVSSASLQNLQTSL